MLVETITNNPEETMKFKISIALLTILISSLMFTPASASQSLIKTQSVVFPEGTTIYVDISNTSGIEDGTSTYPFNTIQEAINVAVSGDVVGVAPGIYFEKVILKAGVQLVGTDPTSTILDGSGSGTVLKMENASLLTGFTVQNGRASFGAGIVTSEFQKLQRILSRTMHKPAAEQVLPFMETTVHPSLLEI
jgi:hypothetical protein